MRMRKRARSARTPLLTLVLLGLWSAGAVGAGPTPWLTIRDIRTYEGGLVVRVAETINSACQYPDHLQLFSNNPNYAASVALFMAAWGQGKRIAAYYTGCGPTGAASGAGNVYVYGWHVEP